MRQRSALPFSCTVMTRSGWVDMGWVGAAWVDCVCVDAVVMGTVWVVTGTVVRGCWLRARPLRARPLTTRPPHVSATMRAPLRNERTIDGLLVRSKAPARGAAGAVFAYTPLDFCREAVEKVSGTFSDRPRRPTFARVVAAQEGSRHLFDSLLVIGYAEAIHKSGFAECSESPDSLQVSDVKGGKGVGRGEMGVNQGRGARAEGRGMRGEG